jgi:hypothetical protein
MALGNFFYRFGNKQSGNKSLDLTNSEKSKLATVRSTIFAALNGNEPTKEEVINKVALSDVKDIGNFIPQFTSATSVLSRFIYNVDRDKRARLQTYREMAKYPEISFAVDEYVDEAVNEDKDGNYIQLVIKNKELNKNENQRKTLIAEFNYICDHVLRIENFIDQWFREFMVDGEIFFEKIIDNADETKGIIKVKKLMTTRVNPIWKDLESDEILFFAYQTDETELLNYPVEAIAYANSGLYEWSRDESNKIVLSFLEEAKTTYKRLKLLEDALVIYRIVRAPERRVFKIDVGNLPKGRAEQFMNEMITRYRQKKFFNTETGDISESLDSMAMTEDFWFPVFQGGRSSEVSSLPGGCLTLDTKIPLLDGRELELRQIIDEHTNGKQNWVYSCDPITGEIKPGKIDRAGITKRNAKLMRLTFDNGESVRCTPEHKFPIIGKGMVEAKYLKENDSIIPLNKKVKKYKDGQDREYVYDNKAKKWKQTLQVVSESIKESKYYNQLEFKLTEDKKSPVFNKLSDSRRKILEKRSIKCPQELFKIIIDSVRIEENKNSQHIFNMLSRNEIFTNKFNECNIGTHSNFKGITNSNLIKIVKSYGYNNWKHFKNDASLFNHRVVSIEHLNETEDVGDLQIDNKHIIHNYHTYAISSGVFVSNSGLGEIEDVEYFRNKLYQGLKIPKSRFGEDSKFSIGDTSDITREEQKFVKAVKRFTRRFAECICSVYITHLKLKGIANEFGVDEQDISVHLLSNNLFEKFMEAQVLDLRFKNFSHFAEFIDTDKPLFSREWVSKKYLEMDEESWNENLKMLVSEEDSSDEDEETESGI